MSISKMIEEKHRFRQGLIMRNRAYATLIPGDPNCSIEPVMLAKGSVSLPQDCVDGNAWMVDTYLYRKPGQKTMTKPFVSVREQWVKGIDVFRREREITLNLEPDFKRRPINPRMEQALDTTHIAFDTVPWETLEQAEMVRDVFDGWRATRCLKTMEDYEDFEDLMLCALTFSKLLERNQRPPIKVTKSGSLGILQRMFLRVYVQKALNIEVGYNYREVADIFSSLGCETTRDDVKNAGRAKFYPQIVPRTPRVLGVLVDLKLLFKGFDEKEFLAPFDV